MDGPNVGYCDPPKLEVACFGPAPVHPCSYRSVARTAAAPHTIRDSKTLARRGHANDSAHACRRTATWASCAGEASRGSPGEYRSTMLQRRLLTLKRVLGVALIAVMFGVPQVGRTDDPLSRVVNGATFDQFVSQTLREYGVPGAVVAIAGSNGPTFIKGYGVREIGESATVDENTRFQIGSVSKFVAATAVGTVVDRGKVGWDRPIHSFNPELALAEPYATKWVTLRDFFAMRSGLPAYGGDILQRYDLSSAQLVKRVRYLAFDHSFRELYAYSNYGIFLGQESAAHSIGLSPPELLQQSIFTPLGMTRSGPSLATLKQDQNYSFAHNVDGSVMPFENVNAFSGAGAIVSTGVDIAKWMQMLLARGSYAGKQILKPGTVDQIFAASMVAGTRGPIPDPNYSAGLGCESYHFLRYRVIEKNGAVNGVRAIVTLIPEKNVGIAVFANKQLTVFPEAIRAEFLERYLGPSGVDLQAQTLKEQAAWTGLLDHPKPPADAKPPGHRLSAYTGTYTSRLYGLLRVSDQGGSLQAAVGPHGYAGHLLHYSGDAFLLWFDDPDVQPGILTFKFDRDNKVIGINGSAVVNVLTANYGRFDLCSPRVLCQASATKLLYSRRAHAGRKVPDPSLTWNVMVYDGSVNAVLEGTTGWKI
jgi:CubicO group peptidase (beta-lactamase class C family)